ncbi:MULTISPECIES: hypothetical protein [unclassified Imperialibacter]|uniref:hypothetical protein n=1 Tax=unclassified Imperialibacter TaxID=2629706 RepID=UPI00186AA00D|nr:MULTISPECIES: hypothetical protein [unclassified Imperialibacter]
MPIPRNEGGIPLMMAGGVIGSAIGHGDFSVSLRSDDCYGGGGASSALVVNAIISSA